MILLTSINDTLALVTASACSIDYTASYADITTTTFAPGAGQGAVTTGATTTIVAAPAASTQRQIKLVTVRNKDTANSQTLYLAKVVSGTAYRMTPDIVLAAGETLQYLDGQGFSVLDPFARSKQASSATLVNTPGVNNPYFVQNNDESAILNQVLMELRIMNLMIANAFSQNLELDALRSDLSYSLTS